MTCGQLQRIARDSADFARDADDAVQVGPVGRDFEVIDDVAAGAAEVFGKRLADLASSRRMSRPSTVLGQAEFLRRAHHAVRFDAADLADLDGEGRFAGLGGQGGARQDERHFVAGLEVLRPADDLPLALAVIDPADGELVRVGMLVSGDDLGDDDAVELAAELLRRLRPRGRAWSAARPVPRATSRNRRIV